MEDSLHPGDKELLAHFSFASAPSYLPIRVKPRDLRMNVSPTVAMWLAPAAILVTFWGDEHCDSGSSALSPMAVVALVKCFDLEWSVDLDYQMYHDFPLEMYLG